MNKECKVWSVNDNYRLGENIQSMFNYRDSEKCVEFAKIQKIMGKKKNTDNPKDYQCSPIKVFGEPSEIRTHIYDFYNFLLFIINGSIIRF